MLMISLDDAVKVAKRLIADNTDDDEIIRQELVQKCRNDAWRQQEASMVAESMNKVISGINSTEICNQITSDNLRKWCEWTQCKLRIAMNYLPYQGKALPSAQPKILRCKDCRHGVDYYHEGDCYCLNPKWGLTYFGGSWEFYCADAERRTTHESKQEGLCCN